MTPPDYATDGAPSVEGTPSAFGSAKDRWGNLGDMPGGEAYGPMIDDLRDFLDKVAAALPDEATSASLGDDLRAWTERLAPLEVPERRQAFGHRVDLPGRGQTMAPRFELTEADPMHVRGTVAYGRYFLGGNGAVHGGAIPLLFDEILGRLANSGGRAPSRTAYLHTDFRSITPVGKLLDVHAWFVSEEGRKRIIRAEIHDGDTLCAESEGLFVALNPGQP